ncbi:hypothetical protein RF11_13308 [Thelohanellus kitauei]|uniref:Uncharacterized protein n=1 Tax=Thelohanellus kitauei TaxID=669202 RepID=A0A0C2N3Z1_THEKT|nr:hypothetical protein RF11_13308 [Thelohanellus kitauei]
MKILLSGLVTPTYLKLLQKRLWDGDRITCLITNPSPLFNIKIPFVLPPGRNTSRITHELPENYKFAAINKDIFIYFIATCYEAQMFNHLEGLSLYFDNIPETLRKNTKIVYEHIPGWFGPKNMKNTDSVFLKLESLMEKHKVDGTIIQYSQLSRHQSYFSTTNLSINKLVVRDFGHVGGHKFKSHDLDVEKDISPTKLIEKVIGDPNSTNKIFCAESQLVEFKTNEEGNPVVQY